MTGTADGQKFCQPLNDTKEYGLDNSYLNSPYQNSKFLPAGRQELQMSILKLPQRNVIKDFLNFEHWIIGICLEFGACYLVLLCPSSDTVNLTLSSISFLIS
jgi:hypothetical protein